MVISSLVVETAPDYTDAVAKQLVAYTGVEVHDVIEGYKIVITIEAETVDASHDLASELALLTGVLNVQLVYVNFEDDKTIYPDGV